MSSPSTNAVSSPGSGWPPPPATRLRRRRTASGRSAICLPPSLIIFGLRGTGSLLRGRLNWDFLQVFFETGTNIYLQVANVGLDSFFRLPPAHAPAHHAAKD